VWRGRLVIRFVEQRPGQAVAECGQVFPEALREGLEWEDERRLVA
jgi:hypothetical protein